MLEVVQYHPDQAAACLHIYISMFREVLQVNAGASLCLLSRSTVLQRLSAMTPDTNMLVLIEHD